jgi:uncharacterized membrane-anchored protein YhcB (DUF1043 family)
MTHSSGFWFTVWPLFLGIIIGIAIGIVVTLIATAILRNRRKNVI